MMNEIIFINKDTNGKFMTSLANYAVVPQIGAYALIEDPEGAVWEGEVDSVYHQYNSTNKNVIYVVLKKLHQIESLPF